MNLTWKRHAKDAKEQDELRAALTGNHLLFSTLKSILEEKIHDCTTRRVATKRFATSSWSHEQADCNAEERTLKMVIDLLPKEK